VRKTVGKTLSAFRFASFALCALSLVGIRAYGQGRETGSERISGVAQDEAKPVDPSNVTDPQAAPPADPSTSAAPDVAPPTDPSIVIGLDGALPVEPSKVIVPEEVRPIERSNVIEPGNAPVVEHPNGIVQDWSNNHAVYPRVGPIQSLIAVQRDPRAIQSWQAAVRKDWLRYNSTRNFHHNHGSVRVDWNISLGTSGMAPAMFPAKFTFDTTAAPSCATDFIVYSVNATGSSTQPNIVGFNNLYSGTGGSVGICNRTPATNDDGVSATTLWSYNITAAGGQVPTSPALSSDGTKVAFVESKSATTAHFHVLAWKSGDGVDPVSTDVGGLQNVLKPLTINSLTPFATHAPAAGSGTATDLVLGSASDTLSSPFVEYGTDLAYVGNDNGILFRVKDVFCPTVAPVADPACLGGTPPPPSLDTTWGASGALTIGGTCTGVLGKLTGPVVDFSTGNVFVGCADGKLYGFTSAGVAITGSPLTVGDATATGGIVDPPMVDNVNGFVYAESGSNGGSAVLFQAKTSNFTLPAPVKATLGAGGFINLHAPAFNDNYFSSVTSTDWLLYAPAVNASGTQSALYGITFGALHAMTAGTPANVDNFPFGLSEFSPATEFLSSAAPAEDRLFESALSNFSGNLASFNISTTFPAGLEGFATEGTGTTGIVVDNASSLAQADSIYFGVVGAGTNANDAVKLTQTNPLQ